MNAQQQVSEGFPIDGATTRIFEPPKVNEDNSKSRYLGFIGSFITPEVAVQRWWTKGGGFEIANPCLRHVRNFLRRGKITPLLRDTHDFLPYDYVQKTMDSNPLESGYFAQQVPADYRPPYLPPANGQGMLGLGARGPESAYGMMVGKLALPGVQIAALLHGDDNVDRNFGRKGIVEFTSLYGHNYQLRRMADGSLADPELWAIQRAIFPDFPILPTTLDEVAALLDAAAIHTELIPIVDAFQTSLSEFRDYADIYIQNVHQQMRERAPNGYVRPYTAGDLVLLAQLGMERQDRSSRNVSITGTSDSELKEIFAAYLKAQTEEKQELTRMRQEQEQKSVPIIDASTMMAAPESVRTDYEFQHAQSATGAQVLTNATPEGAAQIVEAMSDVEPLDAPSFICTACNKPFTSEQGLAMHRTRWCEKLNGGE